MLEQTKQKETKGKKNKANKSQKSFQLKTSTCRDGTLTNQPNKIGTTPLLIHPPYILCLFANHAHNKTLYTPATPTTRKTTLPPAFSHCTTQLTLQTHQHSIMYTPTQYCSQHTLPLSYNTTLTCRTQQLQKPTTYTTHPYCHSRLSRNTNMYRWETLVPFPT